MANAYDFYKPNLSSEYPEVDGPLSVVTYLQALDHAYTAYRNKLAKRNNLDSEKPSASLDTVDYALFHSPYGKQAIKGHARMLFNDFLADPSAARFADIPNAESLLALSPAASLTDKTVEKTFISAAKAQFKAKVDAGMACSRRLGNMYTGSLYGCLASLVSKVEPASLKGKRVSMFAFGGGCAASVFVLNVKGDTTEISQKLDLLNRLASMKVVPPQEFIEALAVSLPACVLLFFKLIDFFTLSAP